MAFENIDTKRLIDSLTQIKQSINYKKIENINSNLKSNSVWVSKSRDNLTSAIDKLVNTRYKKLEKELENYLEVAKYIDKYKTLQEELKRDLSDQSKIQEAIKNQATNLRESADRLKDVMISTKNLSVKNIVDTTRAELENNLKAMTAKQQEKKEVMTLLLSKIEALMK